MSDPTGATPPPPPVPRYGEYAPEGYVSPVPPVESPAPAGQSAGPAYPAPAAAGPRTRKTWDVVLTVILLVIGAFGALIGIGMAALYTDPELLDQGLQAQGYGTFDGEVGATQAIIVVSHIVLYLLAVGISIPLLLAKRIAFWVPLAAGVIAAIFFWASLTAMLMTDPGLISQIS